MTAKDMRLTFRVHSDLKERLESVAASEGRSVAQICEAFLQAGLMKYEKEGTKYVQKFLARQEQGPKPASGIHKKVVS
jgi:predicted transcriptional regulator